MESLNKKTIDQLMIICHRNKDKTLVQVLCSLFNSVYEIDKDIVSKRIETCYLNGCKL